MRLVLALLAVVLLAGCAAEVKANGPQLPATSVVTGLGPGHAVPPPGQLVFRVRNAGYMVAQYEATSRPSLSVYGDGTAYVTADAGSSSAPGRPVELRRARVPRAALLALLARASGTGLFDGTSPDFGEPGVSDMPTSSVTFHPDATPARTVSAYALQYSGGDDDLPAVQRDARRTLRSIIDAFDHAVVRTGATPYTPDRIDVSELTSTVSSGRPQPWPGPSLARLLRAGPDGPCGVVTGAAAARVYAAALAGGTLHWREGTGVRTLAIRALLPGEPGCER